MRTFLVGYDLDKPDQDYKSLIEKLKSYGTWWHNLDSTWLIRAGDTVTTSGLRDELKAQIGSSDKLLVMEVTGVSWASVGFTKEATDWLYKYVPAKAAA